ncbi:MAG: DUF2780 domain-containing protein [Planctomycetota bacterium]
MDIVAYVAGTLGISESQARGAVGLLLSLAKSRLDGSVFATVLSAVPDGEALLAGAPDTSGGLMSAAAGLMGGFGGAGEAVADAAGAAAGMDKLGLDASQFGPLVGAVQGWLGEHADGDAARALDGLSP